MTFTRSGQINTRKNLTPTNFTPEMTDAVAVTSRVSTVDGSLDVYDHEISLVDRVDPDATRTSDQPPSRPAKKDARKGIRDQVARRKYARHSYERHSKTATSTTDEAAENPSHTEGDSESALRSKRTDTTAHSVQRPRTRGKEEPEDGTVEIDVLYENQRGSFLFGMPLYSHSSLLNFDPAPWVTKDFKDSPVSITDAQVPDPTWEWAWKTWYVDMSYDVDEQGWQYSFAFGKNFTWHGNHPWFHSFVRRRRWLRKRIKKGHEPHSAAKPNTLAAAHELTSDYFTIHQPRELSPQGSNPDGYAGQQQDEVDVDEPPEDVNTIGSLMQALKLARIDREKIEIVKRFIHDSGQELAYLKDAIPEIMSLLVFQTSKQQLLAYLEQVIKEAKEHRDDHGKKHTAEDEAEKRRIDDLLATVGAVKQEIRGLDYWSDRQQVLRGVPRCEADDVSSTAEAKASPTDHVSVEAAQQLQCGSQRIGKGNNTKGKGKG